MINIELLKYVQNNFYYKPNKREDILNLLDQRINDYYFRNGTYPLKIYVGEKYFNIIANTEYTTYFMDNDLKCISYNGIFLYKNNSVKTMVFI